MTLICLRKHNRAQASVDFLTTYGWALLVLLLIIGAIFFMSRGSWSSPNPDCQITNRLKCKNFLVSTSGMDPGKSGLLLELQNNIEVPILIDGIRGLRDELESCTSLSLGVGRSGNISCNINQEYPTGETVSMDIQVFYHRNGTAGENHSVTGFVTSTSICGALAIDTLVGLEPPAWWEPAFTPLSTC